MKNPWFITLTLVRQKLTPQLPIQIRKYFTRLRHRKEWRGKSGIYQIEIGTIKDENESCNIHIHSIVDWDGEGLKKWAPYRGSKKHFLSRIWKDITKGSYIVDAEPCNSPGDAIKYYLTLHMAKRVGNPVHRDLINRCLTGTRLIQGYGTLTHVSLNIHDTVCEHCGAVNSYVSSFDRLYCDVLALCEAGQSSAN